MTGRRVAVLFDGVLEGQATRSFTFEAGTLPSGVYLIRAVGETFTGTQLVTLLK